MKKLTILIVVTSGDLGGTQSSVLNLSRWLVSVGHLVTVGYGEGTFLRDALAEDGILSIKFRHLKRTHNPISNLLFIWEIKKYVDLYKVNIVHFNSSSALIGSIGVKLSRHKPRTVFTVRDLFMIDPEYKINLILRFFYITFFKYLFQWIDMVVFVSMRNKYTAIKNKLVTNGAVIFNSIEINKVNILERQNARKYIFSKLPNKDDTNVFMLGSIGRLAYQKNYEFLIRTFPLILEKNPDAQLVIIGEGPERKKYEKQIHKLRLEHVVHLIGSIENASVYAKAFDVFVLPSRYEGMSITVLEMLSVGVPLLVTTVAGNDEIVEGDSRQLFDLDNGEEFLRKISDYIDDKQLLSRVAKENEARNSYFHISETGKRYQNLYHHLMKKRQLGRRTSK